MHEPIVGTTVKAKRTTAICKEGEYGVCYEVYQIGTRPGYSFIFEGGQYDGFSPDEVETMLEIIGYCPETATYRFKSVSYLTADFQRGMFSPAFTRARS